jgi:hypothetical protein
MVLINIENFKSKYEPIISKYSGGDPVKDSYSPFPPGEWDNEPDKIQFFEPYSAYTCLIVRNQFGALCGYVGIPETHPYFEKGYYDLDL